MALKHDLFQNYRFSVNDGVLIEFDQLNAQLTLLKKTNEKPTIENELLKQLINKP